MNIYIAIILYLIGALITFFVSYYKGLKKDRYGEYYAEITETMVITSTFWPLFILVLIIISPFWLMCKIAKKLKKMNNPKKINL